MEAAGVELSVVGRCGVAPGSRAGMAWRWCGQRYEVVGGPGEGGIRCICTRVGQVMVMMGCGLWALCVDKNVSLARAGG